jgi:hypothetical protein
MSDDARTQRPGGSSSPSGTERFRLVGRSRQYDQRIHAVRRDIADIALADHIFAPHYARADQAVLTAPASMLRSAPDDSAQATSQLLHGEGFAVLDIAGRWAWGYCTHDHYVGYVRADTLGLKPPPRTS